MNVLLPIFPRTVEETELLHDTAPDALLPATLARLSGLNGHPVTVVTSRPEIAPLVEQYGATCLALRDAQLSDPAPDRIPAGTRQALDLVCGLHGWPADAPVLLLDYRTPLVDAALLDQAMRSITDQRPLVTVNTVEDHPVQMERYYRVLALDTLCLRQQPLPDWLEKAAAGEAWFLSMPFQFGWLYFGIGSPDPRKVYTRRRVTWCPYLAPVAAAGLAPEGTHFIAGGARKACRLLPFHLPPEVAGLSVYSDSSILPAMLRAAPGETVELYASELLLRQCTLLRIWSCDAEGLAQSGFTDVHPQELRSIDPLDISLSAFPSGGRLRGPLARMPRSVVANGLLLAFLASGLQGEFDLVEPLELQQDLWDIDPDTGMRINRALGDTIRGRQDYPPVYVRNATLSILRPAQAEALADPYAAVQAFPIPANQACSVRSRLDLLRLKAVSKARAHAPSPALDQPASLHLEQTPRHQQGSSPSCPAVEGKEAKDNSTQAIFQQKLASIRLKLDAMLKALDPEGSTKSNSSVKTRTLDPTVTLAAIEAIDSTIRELHEEFHTLSAPVLAIRKIWLVDKQIASRQPFLSKLVSAATARVFSWIHALRTLETQPDQVRLTLKKRELAQLEQSNCSENTRQACSAVLALDPTDADARNRLARLWSQDIHAALEKGDVAAALATGRNYLALNSPSLPDPYLAARLLDAAGEQRATLQAELDFFALDLEHESTLEYRSPIQHSHLYRFDIADDGRIFALDTSNRCIHVIGKDGRNLGIFGKAGQGKLEFSSPRGLWLNKKRLFVSELDLPRLLVLDREGRLETIITGPSDGPTFLAGPVDIAFTSEGHVLVLDTRDRRAYRFDASWRPITTYCSGTAHIPWHDSTLITLAWMEDRQQVFVSDFKGHVFAFAGSGALQHEFTLTVLGAPCRRVFSLSAPGDELLFWDSGRGLLIRLKPGQPAVALPLSRLLPEVRPETISYLRWSQALERVVAVDTSLRFHFLRYRSRP